LKIAILGMARTGEIAACAEAFRVHCSAIAAGEKRRPSRSLPLFNVLLSSLATDGRPVTLFDDLMANRGGA
jgi:hypothetical protein